VLCIADRFVKYPVVQVTIPILTFPDGVLVGDAPLRVTFNSGAQISPKMDATTVTMFQLPTIVGYDGGLFHFGENLI
jgi:hypothetical protein